MPAPRDITPLVVPRSIAVIGASSNPAKSGGFLFKALVDGGYGGRLYPINPRADVLLGHQAYPKLADVPEAVDMVFIVLPRPAVKEALAQCAESGARSACIITAGYGENGPAGEADEAELRAIARQGGVLTIGPNTIGTINAEAKMMGSFVPFSSWRQGPVSIFAQTGLFAGAFMLQLMSQENQRLGIGKSIDVGNKLDVDEIDFLHYVARDPGTRVIGLHLEEIRDLQAFAELAGRVGRQKPIVVLKTGRTPAGAATSGRHTGSRPMDEAEVSLALERAGLTRAEDIDDFVACLKGFEYLPVPRGNRLGIVTYSGALGVMAVDELAGSGLTLAHFAERTDARVQALLPPGQPAANPADFGAGTLEILGNRAGHEQPFRAILDDPGTDLVLGIVLTPPNCDFPEVREVFAGLRAAQPDKPLALVLYGGAVRDRWLGELEGLGIPIFPSTRTAVRALAALARLCGR